MSLSTLAIDRIHVTKVVAAATGTGVTNSNPFTKHPTPDFGTVLVALATGVFTVCTADLEQSNDSGASWQVSVAGWDLKAIPIDQFQIAENVLYRFNVKTFTGTSVTVNVSTTSEEALLATGQSANKVLASPDGTAGFLSVRSLVAADIPSLSASYATKANPSITGNETINGAHGEQWILGQATELITLNTGASHTDSSSNLLPANSIIESVVARVTTTITTAANWSLGDSVTPTRFSVAGTGLTAGSTQIGLNHQQGSISTDATGPVQLVAAPVRITLNTNPGAGVVRVTVFYRQLVAPTS